MLRVLCWSGASKKQTWKTWKRFIGVGGDTPVKDKWGELERVEEPSGAKRV